MLLAYLLNKKLSIIGIKKGRARKEYQGIATIC